MMIQEYTEDLFDTVKHLVQECDQDPIVRGMGGMGFVAVENGEAVGFVWALTSEHSCVAYIDWFCVNEEHRRKGLGVALMTKMIVYLKSIGKTRVVGVVVDTSVLSVAHIYHKAGMTVKPGFSVGGDPSKIIEGLKEVNHGR